jgi:hypothetical protein
MLMTIFSFPNLGPIAEGWVKRPIDGREETKKALASPEGVNRALDERRKGSCYPEIFERSSAV